MGRIKGQAGTIYKIGGNWIGRYRTVIDGKKVRPPVYIGPATGKDKLTESEARRMLRLKLDEMGVNSTETLLIGKGLGETFEQKVQWWKENKLILCKPSSASVPYVIKKHLTPVFGHMLVSQIDDKKVQEWVTGLVNEKKLAPKSISNVWKIFKVILGKKHTIGWSIALPPIPKSKRRFLTPEEVEKIINEAEGQFKVLFALHFAAGMRFGELAALFIDDIDFENSIVHIRKSTYRNIDTLPKTDAGYRDVDVDSKILAQLKEFLGDRKEGRIFMTRKGTPLKVGDVNRDVLKPLCEKLGIPKATTHAFRHGRVSVLQKARVPGDLIMEWIGHTSLKMTSKYTHFTPETVKEFAATLERK